MSSFRFLCAIVLAMFAGLSERTLASQPDNARPNIVFILADDLGMGDTKCYGGKLCKIDTPNIDVLAKGGMRFTDAHASASVCVPTRVAIMSGKYPWRFGPPQPGGAWGFLGLRFSTDTFTLGDLLRNAGYRTGYIGKWHLGTEMTTKDGKVQNKTNVDYTKPLKVGPVQYGFDYSFILPGSLDMYPYAFARNNVWQGEVTAQKGWSAFNRVGPAEKNFQDHAVLETLYGEAETFIRKQKKDRPFFLYLALTAPHTPTCPSKKFKGKSKLGVYGDFVMEVDHAVERVINALKESGLHDNTLVLFSSDHGAASYAGNILRATAGQIHLLERLGHFASGPYRGFKFSVYGGGLRVPLIAYWPGVIPRSSECDALVGLNDLMATFAEITGEKLRPRDGPDSISFAKLLRNPKAKRTRQNLIMQSTGPFVVRDGHWKLCLCPGSGSMSRFSSEPTPQKAWPKALKQFGKAPTRKDLNKAPFVQLFDVSKDVHEDDNLAAKHADRVAKMVELLNRQIRKGRSTPGPMLENGRKNISIHWIPEFVRKKLQ